MSVAPLNIMLADDDIDDCSFFKDALAGFTSNTSLTTVHNGEQLMQLLNEEGIVLPDILFLDLNMPRKNGFECLYEIKQSEQLKGIPVIIFSTSFELDVVNRLYESGANYFIRKPAEFSRFEKTIQQSLTLLADGSNTQPDRKDFVFTIQNTLPV
ncbi:MAG: response regulator [Bacteroidota bacterium]